MMGACRHKHHAALTRRDQDPKPATPCTCRGRPGHGRGNVMTKPSYRITTKAYIISDASAYRAHDRCCRHRRRRARRPRAALRGPAGRGRHAYGRRRSSARCAPGWAGRRGWRWGIGPAGSSPAVALPGFPAGGVSESARRCKHGLQWGPAVAVLAGGVRPTW